MSNVLFQKLYFHVTHWLNEVWLKYHHLWDCFHNKEGRLSLMYCLPPATDWDIPLLLWVSKYKMKWGPVFRLLCSMEGQEMQVQNEAKVTEIYWKCWGIPRGGKI